MKWYHHSTKAAWDAVDFPSRHRSAERTEYQCQFYLNRDFIYILHVLLQARASVIAYYFTTVLITLKKGHKPETFALFQKHLTLFDISLSNITTSACHAALTVQFPFNICFWLLTCVASFNFFKPPFNDTGGKLPIIPCWLIYGIFFELPRKKKRNLARSRFLFRDHPNASAALYNLWHASSYTTLQ